MKQANAIQIKVYQELVALTGWTIQMIDQNAIAYGGDTVNPNGYNEFCDWAAAVRAAVAKVEIADGSPQQIKRTHADVRLPQFKKNEVVKQACQACVVE